MPREDDRCALQAALQHFFELTQRDQLAAYEAIREHLGEQAPAETELDREVRERMESLDALSRAAEHLGLPEGRAPTAKQLNQAAAELGLEWDASRVTRRWKRWRFATEAYEGQRTRATDHLKASLRQGEGRRYSDEECLAALRLWLETKPARETKAEYQRWYVSYNEQLPADERRVPSWQPISHRLGIGFREAVEVARGRLNLEEARKVGEERKTRERADWSRTEHEFVGVEWVARHLGVPPEKARAVAMGQHFPPPVVVFHQRRAWLRDDLEAFFRGDPVPHRERGELQHLYLSSRDVAEMIGRHPSAFAKGFGALPEPAGMVSYRFFFLRSEVEQWMRDNPQRIGRRDAREREDSTSD